MKKLTGMGFLVLALSASVAQATIKKNTGGKIKVEIVDEQILRKEIAEKMEEFIVGADIRSNAKLKLWLPKEDAKPFGLILERNKQMNEQYQGYNDIQKLASAIILFYRIYKMNAAFEAPRVDVDDIASYIINILNTEISVDNLQFSVSIDNAPIWLVLFMGASDKK